MRKWRRIFALFLTCMTFLISVQVHAEEAEENATAQRIQKAEELGLSEWIDEEGYLTDDFFAGKSDSEISNMSLDGLVRVLSEEEIDAFAANLKAGISTFAVTKYQKIAQINPSTGRYLYTGLFEVDGILAFCIERDAVTPAQGSTTSEWIAVTNDEIRKVLYYGYNGPVNCGYTFVETAMAAAEANGRGDNSLGREIYAQIKEMEVPPEDFYVWKVETNDGGTQELVFYTYDKDTGYLQLEKTSAYPELTNYNSSFSLQNAVYGVYEDLACTVEVGRLITDRNGVSNELELKFGTYYVKELEAPRGFEINPSIEMVSVIEDEYTVLSAVDKPAVRVELTKYIEQSKTVLEGARFKHINPDGTEEEQITGADGKIIWNHLQEGVHRIEEVEAPAGYIRNRNPIIFEVDEKRKITVTSQVDGLYGNIKSKCDYAGNLLIDVENKIGYKLPNTGSYNEIIMYITGSFLAARSMKKRRLRYEK